jgi:hypothetical protein
MNSTAAGLDLASKAFPKPSEAVELIAPMSSSGHVHVAARLLRGAVSTLSWEALALVLAVNSQPDMPPLMDGRRRQSGSDRFGGE